VFYRILRAPPGYPAHQKYMVSAYTTLEYSSSCGYIANEVGTRFFATLEEARQAMPQDARKLPFEQEDQFLELWEVSAPGR
jgi:hypothetical protein